MKFPIKKILFSTIFSLLFFFCLALLKDNYSVSFVNNACATCWGSACPGGNTTYYSTCPQTGSVIAGPIDSADVHVTVSSIGSSPIPQGQRLLITVCPSTGCTAQNACSDVTCLNRSIENYPVTWNGPGSVDLTFDTLGCSLNGTCSNNYIVKVRFDPNNILDSALSCPNDDKPITLINDNMQTAAVALNCSKPVSYTCTTTSNRQCQQNQTNTNGCADGWTPDTTNPALTCDQTGGRNACCVQVACVKPPQPAPSLICTL